MPHAPTNLRARPGAGAAALLGAAVVLGWSSFDLTVFLTSGAPEVTLRLLPGILAAVLAGALAGGLLCAHRALPLVLVLVAGLATAATGLPTKYLPDYHNWFVRACFLMLGIYWVADQARRLWGLDVLRLGASLGYLAAMAVALWLNVRPLGVWWVGAGSMLAVLLLAWLPRPAIRRALTAVAVLVAVLYLAYAVSLIHRPMRPDVSPSAERAQGPNLVLIVMDTVRADRLSCYGHERETSPALDAFASESATRYTNAFSTSSWTLPSHASLMTGLFPAQHGATATRGEANHLTNRQGSWPCQPIDPEAPMLAAALFDLGYRTGAVIGNAFNVRHDFGFGKGFERFDDRYGTYTRGHHALVQMAGWQLSLGGLAYRDASEVTDSALEWLGGVEQDEPFFLFLNYMDPHDPYLPHDDVRFAFSDYEPQDFWKPTEEDVPLQYDREILFTDQQIGRLFEELRARGSFEDSVIVVTSDHGEGLGDHGNLFHSWSLYDELLRVPLLIKPATPRALEVDTTSINLVDVHDLMLRELGLEPPEREEEVTHLAEWYRGTWNESEELQARVERMGQPLDRDLIAWMEGNTKFIVGSTGRVEAYDLDSDPGELEPLELSVAELDAARARAAAWWAAHPPPEVVDRELDEDSAARLKLLGYIDDEDENQD